MRLNGLYHFLPLDIHIYKILIFETIFLLTYSLPGPVIHAIVKVILFSGIEEKRLNLKFIITFDLSHDDFRNTKNK